MDDTTAWKTWSTRRAGRRAAAYWGEAILESVCDAEFQPDRATPFAASLAGRHGIGGRFVAFQAEAHRVRRTARQAARNDDGHYMVGLQRRGSLRALQGGEAVVAQAGEIAVLHSGCPFDLVFPEAVERRLVMLPRCLVDVRLPPSSPLLRGVPVRLRPEASVSGLVVRDAILHLTATGQDWDGPNLRAGLCHLAQALAGASGVEQPLRPSGKPTLALIRSITGRYLTEPGFGLAGLAARLGMSPRSVQRCLAAAGTSFSELLIGMRLEQAQQRLRSGQDRVSILSIAMDAGFSSAAHFSRRYHAEYGETPRETRAASDR